MSNKEKYIGQSKIKGVPKKPLIFKLSEKVKDTLDDLQDQINHIVYDGGIVYNDFGYDQNIGISQKTLTEAINDLWDKIESITGEAYRGISMAVAPSYYIGEDGCTVHIAASALDIAGVFEEIWFYWNDSEEPFAGSAEPTDYFEFDTEIAETTYIKCKAKILGIWHQASKLITHFSSYWLGFGTDYQSIMDKEHLVYPVPHHMRAAYDLIANENDHLFIILGEAIAPEFIRADMNGMEIKFNQSTVTVGDNVYKIFTSKDIYREGAYNIDING